MQEINFYGQISTTQDFDAIKINVASPEQIIAASYGEVEKPETINYRTFNPENRGLFCAKIFGPVKDYECRCGKYRRMKYKGTTCEKCGVEVTTSKVRRERMGHITLAAPVAHIWFLKNIPSKIATLLDIGMKDLEKVLYFEQYIVVEPGMTNLTEKQFLSEEQFMQAQDEFGEDSFVAMIGAEVMQKLLQDLNLQELRDDLQKEFLNTNAEAKKKKIVKRLKLVEDFLDSGNKPEWMIITVLPVMPPDLRPLVMLDGGRFATSDLNELYRRVINRNNRLRRLIELKAPEIIIRNEKRMLQESVDALFDNSKRGKAVKGNSKRPFKSLSDMLKGKQGRFRQNLLGKRVDYSGRSVIVVGPSLKLHQCGLPKKMALEIFKPFIYAKLELYGIATTIKAAKKMVEAERPEVWDILEEVIKEHPVLLNRAPTLHRLGIQAFEPLLVEGKAIHLHPLVCAAFNADFDGDQMAVHIPLSIEAQVEARVLMMSTNNILSPANGKPIILPEEDIILGLCYLTLELENEPGENMVFSNIDEVYHAIYNKKISIHSKIRFRIKKLDSDNKVVSAIENTTAGRLIVRELIEDKLIIGFDLFNKLLTKKEVSTTIDAVYRNFGQKATVIFVDKLMLLGFQYSCSSGISVGMDDMVVPETKNTRIENTMKEIKLFEDQYVDGLITYKEKYNKVIDAWSHCTDQVSDDLMRNISKGDQSPDIANNQMRVNSIYLMAKSGARGSAAQIKQLAGMRGLMAKQTGEIMEKAITGNFKEGLNVVEYFNSTHGARKGLADTALKTANSGYLTRRLVDVCQDCVVIAEDCNTDKGIIVRSIIESGEVIVALADQILGRVVANDILHPVNGEYLVKKNTIIDESNIVKIEEAGIDSIKLRSALTCELEHGICAKCYGRDLSTGKLVCLGEAVGVIAAQSIGEPGTQLTMRTFHIGGAATRRAETSSIEAAFASTIKLIGCNYVENSEQKKIVMSRTCEIVLMDIRNAERARYKVPYGAVLLVTDGEKVTQGQKLSDWDPHTIPIITEKTGKILMKDIADGISVREIIDETTGISSRVITEFRQQGAARSLKPRIHIVDESGQTLTLSNGLEARYYLPSSAVLSFIDGSEVHAGDVIARIPRESSKTKDIIGGLPRVAEIVEARRPKDSAIIAEIDGRIEFGKDYKSKRKIIINPDNNLTPVAYVVPKGKHVVVGEGSYVRKGDMLIDGNPVLHDILKVMGVEALSRYIVNEIQSVYKLQGVKIDDKHIEIVIKQMIQKVEITDPGQTHLFVGDKINKWILKEVNEKAEINGLKPALGTPILQGITKSSLQTKSFISAASFQETTKVLTDAAICGKVDYLSGLKENVIVGRLIPAGTGFYMKEIKELALQRDKESLVTEKTDS
jgi:DNA-directed RNA polymerase subunit beta'